MIQNSRNPIGGSIKLGEKAGEKTYGSIKIGEKLGEKEGCSPIIAKEKTGEKLG